MIATDNESNHDNEYIPFNNSNELWNESLSAERKSILIKTENNNDNITYIFRSVCCMFAVIIVLIIVVILVLVI